jgi:hypothetical protein
MHFGYEVGRLSVAVQFDSLCWSRTLAESEGLEDEHSLS